VDLFNRPISLNNPFIPRGITKGRGGNFFCALNTPPNKNTPPCTKRAHTQKKTYFSKYLVGGVAGYLITQVIINIGVAIGLIPVFGIPLPFISSGGSSLLAISIAMGLVIHVNNTQTLK